MSKQKLGEPARKPSRRKTVSEPRFEIEYETQSHGEGLWAKLRAGAEPIISAAQNALGTVYLVAARSVLDRVETFEDKRAEQTALRRQAGVAQPRPAPASGLIEGPPADKPAKKPASARRPARRKTSPGTGA
ncbi:hypothetical protein V5F32_03825 [Xanthobacter oligotrophicus]|uniref:Uncharacterized protein n=1 Tax=Xanthobacter oligotrophicus TaxID=2607286 RepID=A0ABW6ZUA2_9HYPH